MAFLYPCSFPLEAFDTVDGFAWNLARTSWY